MKKITQGQPKLLSTVIQLFTSERRL